MTDFHKIRRLPPYVFEVVNRLKARLKKIAGLRTDYVELAGDRLCAAVFVGKTRLIDNERLRP